MEISNNDLFREMQILRKEMQALSEQIEVLRTSKVLYKKKAIEKDSVTVSEAADILGITNSGVRKMMHDGRLLWYKPDIGHARIFIQSLSDL